MRDAPHVSIAKHARQTLKSAFASADTVATVFARFWVALDADDDVEGCVGVTSDCEIRCLAVVPRARRRRIASKLLDAAETFCERRPVTLSTIAGMDAAVALYEKRGYELVATRVVPAKAGAFELRSYRKEPPPEPVVDLVAVPLVEDDASKPKVRIAFVGALDTHVTFRLASPLYARLGIVFQLGGRRYVARRPPSAPQHRTIPAQTLVRCELRFLDESDWAVPSFNTFRRKQQPRSDAACVNGEEGPCTCNADCVIA